MRDIWMRFHHSILASACTLIQGEVERRLA
jgi:hypothetical protein